LTGVQTGLESPDVLAEFRLAGKIQKGLKSSDRIAEFRQE
jgi:hypothetical protein